jgi:hypothetical protein
MDLDAYRASAEEFVAELTAEYYHHYAGLKDEYEIEPIYERHASLFSRGAVDALRAEHEAARAGSDEQRRRRMLLDFAVEGHLGQATKELSAALARREAAMSIEVDGERIGFRESPVVQANEPDAERRARIESARLEATDRELNPLYRESIEQQHALARELAFPSYREMCATLKGVDLRGLQSQTGAFIAATEGAYQRKLEPSLRATLGFGLEDLRRSDLPRYFRAPEQDASFPADRLLGSLTETLAGLGISVSDQPGVILDIESRPTKSPRAFCAPVRVPGEVYLVIAPVGGRDDFGTLFHEGGHTEHFAHVDPRLPFEFRLLGDNAITEAYAFLLQHLVEDPVWLSRRLGVDGAEEIASHARAVRLVYVRRYAAKLAYEMELHGGANGIGDGMAGRYSELLGHALGIEWASASFLSDVDPGFYCACYLRAWALETHLRAYLRSQFGEAWFDERAAGEVLRGLWREGQRLSAEELLGELTGQRLEFAVLVDDLGL